VSDIEEANTVWKVSEKAWPSLIHMFGETSEGCDSRRC